uniref:Uncharacterized protein n=1 Tax=Romanomermis culicivorax TaxID=13658 RepID=A0A915JWY6_ROMCU
KELVDNDKGKKLLSYLIDIFIYLSSNKSHQLSQQQIATTFQSLCDDSISLIQGQSESGNIQSLANCLPEQAQLLQICSSLLKNISNNKQPYATVLPALRIFMTLSEHDYGIFCIKKTLDNEQTNFLPLLERLADEFCARNSDCICTFNAFLQLIENLRQRPEGRINKFGVDFIREKVTWKSNDGIFNDNYDDLIASLSKTDEQHPLSKLYNVIQKFIDEDDSLTRMFDSLKDLIAYLCKDNQDDYTVTSQPVVSAMLPIDVQFERRQVYIICKEDFEERLTAQYWFPSLHVDDFLIVQQKSTSSVSSSNGGALRSKLSSMSNKKLIKKR